MPLGSKRPRTAGELQAAFEEYVRSLVVTSELGGLEEALRYALDSGGKRVRPVLCLAVADAAGGSPEHALPAAGAIELVHTFSLVHDDLPALDDDPVRRGRPSAHVAFGDGVALLAGDALLAEAFRLILSYDSPEPARELVAATLGMIGGQFRDVTGDDADLTELHRLKTGQLFSAAVGLGLWCAGVPAPEHAPWRAFADELGLLFQAVDDVLDEDGLATRLGTGEARRVASERAGRTHERLAAVPADTSTLGELVESIAVRAA
jgi:geranylgeranyl diphosphate synthase type II